MRANYIILAVPFFVLAILVEVLLSHRKKLRTYRLHDSIANLGCGVGSQAFAAVTGAFGLYVYHQLQSHVGLLTISESSVLAWVALLLIDDFCYYLYHRGSHRVNVLWATHAVHHQSEEYNLAVALRQSWFTGLTSFVFYLPLALLGFPLAMFLTMRTINTLYQFWIHTRPIGKLGVLEWFLNTPSHHRVHHGVDPRLHRRADGLYRKPALPVRRGRHQGQGAFCRRVQCQVRRKRRPQRRSQPDGRHRGACLYLDRHHAETRKVRRKRPAAFG